MKMKIWKQVELIIILSDVSGMIQIINGTICDVSVFCIVMYQYQYESDGSDGSVVYYNIL